MARGTISKFRPCLPLEAEARQLAERLVDPEGRGPPLWLREGEDDSRAVSLRRLRDRSSSQGPTVASPSRSICDDTDLVTNLATKQKATRLGGFDFAAKSSI